MSLTRTAEEWTSRYEGGAQNPGFARIADAMLREGRIEDAIALATEGLHMQPTSLSGHLVLARCHQEAGRLDEAKTQFEIALRMDPRCPAARYHLAQIAEQLQWKSVALEHWRTLCEIEPWDEKAREAYGRMLREAPGGTPSPKLTQSYQPNAHLAQDSVYNPAASDSLVSADASTPALTEYSLDSVGDFLPKDENSATDLAAALPVSGSEFAFPALEQPTDLNESSESKSNTPESRAYPEPHPVDILDTESEKTTGTQPLEAAPFSGEDVATRLNALFGLSGDPTLGEDLEAQAEAPDVGNASIETQFHSETQIQAYGSATEMHTEATAMTPGEATAMTPGEATDMPTGESEDSPTGEATAYARAAETDFFEGPSPVAGDDVASRLDDIFESTDTQMQEAVKASHVSDLGTGESSTWTPVAPIDTQELKTEPAESEARAAGESNILSIEEVYDTPSSEPEVTGEDIADRLDSLFEESAGASTIFNKAEPVASAAPVDPGTSEHSVFDLTDAHTLAMPVMRESDLHALQKPEPADDLNEARETMILSADILQSEVEAVDTVEAVETPTLSFGSKNLETVDLKPASEAALFATDDALTPESLGLTEVESGDIGQRLDDIFGQEGESAIIPRVKVPEPESSSTLDAALGLETLETAIAPSPDMAFDAPVQGEAMVSGDDISSRLAEIFGTNADDAPTAEANALEDAARGTHYELAEDMPTMAIRVSRPEAEPIAGETTDADFPPWLAEPEAQPDAESKSATITTTDFPKHSATQAEVSAEDEGDGEEEAFEPATTSVATVTLAEIYFTQGLKEQALQIYRQLLEREPENESVRKRVQEIEASKAEGDDKGSGPDDSRPRPGLKIPRRKK
jgi:Tetratricopeptide repeat